MLPPTKGQGGPSFTEGQSNFPLTKEEGVQGEARKKTSSKGVSKPMCICSRIALMFEGLVP